MSPWIRRTLIALAAVLLVLVALAVWLVSSFDPNRYKGVAVDWMKTHRQRTLVIGGPIELSVFPRLAVRLSQVTLSEPRRAETFAAIDRAALSVALLPLLRGELQVDRVEASGVRVQLTRDAQGRRNTDDLAGGADGAAGAGATPSADTGGAGKPMVFDISGITLKDVRARVQDAAAQLDGELQLVELTSGRLAGGVESPVTLNAKLDFRKPVLKGELSGRTKLRPDLATGSVQLSDMQLAWKGDLPGARAVDAALTGALAWDGAKGALEARQVVLKLAAQAAGLQLKDSSVALERFAYDPARQALALGRLQLKLQGQRDGGPLALELDWPELDVQGQRLKGSPLQGKLVLGGAAPLDVNFKTGAPTGSFEAVTLPALEARVVAGGGGQPVEGSVRGTVTAGPKAAQWALAGTVNRNAFTVDGQARLDGAVPFVKAQAKFDALELNTLLPAGASGGAAPGAPAPADAPVDLSGLKAVNANLALRAGSLTFRQVRVADARLDATLDNGLLRVSTLQGKAWGGALDANATADARSQRIGVKAAAQGVNVNALLKDVAGKDLLEGTGRVTLDVNTTGRSVGALRSALQGSAALQLRDGAVKGINLAKSLRQARSALGLGGDSAQKSVQAEKTDFSELSASFQIADGVARSNDLDVKSPYLRIGGDGLVDIGKGRIDYTTRVSVTNTASGQGGAELAALKGLTIPVRLSGPFEAIDWNIRWSAVAAGAVQNKLEDKLKERLGLKPAAPAASAASAPAASPKDRLKDKLLKGIFK
ncbi:MAG: AsmA family protein [Piscinibacter sp.]|nr:AsmA family protein [Piscinibacter sp.]